MAEAERHRSSLKQQNKPYKGKSKSKTAKGGRTVPTAVHVQDWTEKSKADRKNAAVQKRKHLRENLVQKARGQASSGMMKVVGLLALHHDADLDNLLESLEGSCAMGEGLRTTDGMPVVFVKVGRDELSVLDYGKIVDCFLHVFNCANADLKKAKIDPSTCSAYDEIGYKLLSALKSQGFPPALGVLQGLDSISPKRQKEVKKLYNRYFLSEVPEGGKLRPSSKVPEILRDISTLTRNNEELSFRSIRSYFYAQSINSEVGFTDFTGIIKGSGHLNVNQLVHITGVGDFSISLLKTSQGEFFPDNPESIICEKDPGPFAAEQTWPNEDDLADAFSKLEVKTDHPPCDLDHEEDEELQMSDDEKQVFEFQERKSEDFDFPDEVNTPHDQLAKVRFQKYRGLASFRTSEWDKYENLPVEYSKIYEFKEPCHIVKQAAFESIQDKTQVSLGMLVTIRIHNFPVHLLNPLLPVVVSSLLPHERKLSVLHFRLERSGNIDCEVKSKSPVVVHYGFRRISCCPVFSEDTSSDKSKYLRKAEANCSFVASVFAPVCFAPANVLVYQDSMEGPVLVAVGSLMSFDPGRLIIKRVLLTGYPLKVMTK